MSVSFLYKQMAPLIEINLRSRSSTLVAISQEVAQYVAYLTQADASLQISAQARQLPAQKEWDVPPTPTESIVYLLCLKLDEGVHAPGVAVKNSRLLVIARLIAIHGQSARSIILERVLDQLLKKEADTAVSNLTDLIYTA